MCSAWTAFGSSYTLGKNNHGTERKRVIRSSFPFRALVCWKFLNAGICLFLLAIEVTMLPSGWVICDLACHGSHGCTGCQRWTWCAHVVWDLWILHCALKLVSSGQCNYMCAQIAVSMKYSCQQHSSLQHQRTFACLERGWREKQFRKSFQVRILCTLYVWVDRAGILEPAAPQRLLVCKLGLKTVRFPHLSNFAILGRKKIQLYKII